MNAGWFRRNQPAIQAAFTVEVCYPVPIVRDPANPASHALGHSVRRLPLTDDPANYDGAAPHSHVEAIDDLGARGHRDANLHDREAGNDPHVGVAGSGVPLDHNHDDDEPSREGVGEWTGVQNGSLGLGRDHALSLDGEDHGPLLAPADRARASVCQRSERIRVDPARHGVFPDVTRLDAEQYERPDRQRGPDLEADYHFAHRVQPDGLLWQVERDGGEERAEYFVNPRRDAWRESRRDGFVYRPFGREGPVDRRVDHRAERVFPPLSFCLVRDCPYDGVERRHPVPVNGRADSAPCSYYRPESVRHP